MDETAAQVADMTPEQLREFVDDGFRMVNERRERMAASYRRVTETQRAITRSLNSMELRLCQLREILTEKGMI